MPDNTALHGYVTRLETIAEERAALNADAKVVYDEVREAGLNVAAVRQIVKERRMERDALHTWNATLDEYREALGMLAGTPLGDAMEPARPTAEYPARPFSEQPVHEPRRRGRPRRQTSVDAALEQARSHLNPDAGVWADQVDRTVQPL